MAWNPADHEDDEFLGAGCRRTVYAYDDTTVIKIDSEDYADYRSNRAEVAVWNIVKDTPDARYFAAVLDYTDDGWLMQERCQPMRGYFDEHPDWAAIREVCYRLDIVDFHDRNFGLRKDGSMCLIDYGAYMPMWRR